MASAYPDIVRRYFADPPCLGPLAGDDVRRGEAGAPATGTWIVIESIVREGRCVELAFRAYGCPWTVAATALAVERLQGAPLTSLLDFAPLDLAAELNLPVEKRGSLLTLQDALRNCFRAWDTTRPIGGPP
jgi:NifU-like protein involved in Fe-S cluster formation